MSFLNLRATLSSPREEPANGLANGLDRLARELDVIVLSITPHAEYKGFFIYVISGLCLATWIGWALLPPWFLSDYLGISYYPDKYWSVAIPGWSLIAMAFTYYYVALYNTEIKQFKLNDVRQVVDDTTRFASRDNIHQLLAEVMDLPITLVNEVLYDS